MLDYIENKIIRGLPYKGGKGKLATKILNSIHSKIGYKEKVYDLFGGGGSFSLASKYAGHTVHYNELNKYVYSIFYYIINGGKVSFDWVTREKFKDVLENKNNYPEWYVGLVMQCWTFGNNQGNYLYGKDIENDKYILHQLCVDKNVVPFNERFNAAFGLEECNMTSVRKFLKDKADLEHLQRLEHLQHLEHLSFSDGSYETVLIKSDSFIYCDIPYKGTSPYSQGLKHETKGEFDYEKFYHWALNNDSPVFISEYNMPDDFILIDEFNHRSTLSSTNNSKITIEKLYWNGKR